VGGVNGNGGGHGSGRAPSTLWGDWPRVAAALAGPGTLLACLDYDGTLAPIRERPAEVATPPAVAPALAELAARPATEVAAVSGRRIEELAERLPAGLWLVGLHGLEMRGPDGRGDHGWQGGGSPAAAASLDALRRLAERLAGCVPGLRLEDKGRALALHTRSVPGAHGRDVARVFAGAAAGCRGVRAIAGKEVVEVVPEGAGKGRAVARLRERLAPGGPVLFVGDDATDEDAFAALAETGAVTVRVGGKRPTRARYRVADPAAVAELLRRVARLPADDAALDRRIA
jgi:trehalose-phosphatase